MKYKGFGIYIRQRKTADGSTQEDYRIIPPGGIDWPEHLQKSGPALKTERLTIEHMQRLVDRVDSRNYNIEIGRAVNSTEPIEKLFDLYRKYGKSYGGKAGWSAKHFRDSGSALETWRKVLGLKWVTDIKRIPFEREIDRLLESGLRPGTVENRARFLTGFCGYAKEHDLLAEDPLASWPGLDTTPEVIHGRLDPAEIRQILICPTVTLKRKIIYGLAYFCRLRRGEINSLTVRSMDWLRGGVQLDYKKVKNRDADKCWVPVPQPLLGWIWDDCLGRGLDERLTSISKNNAIKYFRRDLKRANLPRVKDGLERTFHGLGASTATNLEEAGASPFAIQDVMRHASVDTSGVYLRERLNRVRGAQRLLVDEIFPGNGKSPEESGSQSWQKIGDKKEEPLQLIELQGLSLVGMAGFENETPASHLPGSSPKSPEKPNSVPFPLGKHLSGTPRKLSAKEGSEILAKAWQRLSDPIFADLLRILPRLTAEELAEVLDQLKGRLGRQDGRAHA